jgi:hypothetical protein
MNTAPLHSPPSTFHSKRGVVALITVIIMGAMLLSLGVSAAFLSQTQLIITAGTGRQREAFALATTCVEEAVHRLKTNSSYTGGTIPIDANTCTVTVAGSGSTRTVTASSTVDVYTKGITVTLTLKQNAALNSQAWSVTSWAETDPP